MTQNSEAAASTASAADESVPSGSKPREVAPGAPRLPSTRDIAPASWDSSAHRQGLSWTAVRVGVRLGGGGREKRRNWRNSPPVHKNVHAAKHGARRSTSPFL